MNNEAGASGAKFLFNVLVHFFLEYVILCQDYLYI